MFPTVPKSVRNTSALHWEHSSFALPTLALTVPYGRARENRASHMGKQRLSHGVTTIGFCYGTSGTLGTEGTDAQERVPPAWRYEATTDATRREGHAPAWPSEGGGRYGARPSLRWGFEFPTLGVHPPYVGGSVSLH